MGHNKIFKLASIFYKKAQVLELGESAPVGGLEANIMNQQNQQELLAMAPSLGQSLKAGLDAVDKETFQLTDDNLQEVAEVLIKGQLPDKVLMQAAMQEYNAGYRSIEGLWNLRHQLERYL